MTTSFNVNSFFVLKKAKFVYFILFIYFNFVYFEVKDVKQPLLNVFKNFLLEEESQVLQAVSFKKRFDSKKPLSNKLFLFFKNKIPNYRPTFICNSFYLLLELSSKQNFILDNSCRCYV